MIEDSLYALQSKSRWRARAEIRELADHLAERPAFGGCTSEDLVEMVRIATPVTIPAHWAFVQQGSPAHALYVLVSGDARVFRHRREIAEVHSGDLVGELALLQKTLRTATVASANPMKALRVDYAGLDDVLARRPQLRDAIHDIAREHAAA